MSDTTGLPLEAQAPVVETVAVLESHIDHLSGEELGHAFDRLQAAGALDVLWMPGIMKKNRPGGCLRVICTPEDLETVQSAFFAHTHTLGIRRCLMERVVLPRAATTLPSSQGPLAAKAYVVDGQRYTRPEYEALAQTGLPLPHLRFSQKDTGNTDPEE